jgi:hypothetical protein
MQHSQKQSTYVILGFTEKFTGWHLDGFKKKIYLHYSLL